MDWAYSIYDAVQLIIPTVTFFLLIIADLVYIILFIRAKERIYISGLLVSLCATLYVFFEALVVITGWTNNIETGRLFHRMGQLTGAYFTFSLMFLLNTLTHSQKILQIITRIFCWIGLSSAIILTVFAFIFPDSFISTQHKAIREIVSAGDFSRGAIGPLYSVRDISLALSVIASLILCTFALITNKKDKKIPLILTGIIFTILGGVDDIIFYQFGHNFTLNAFRFSRLSVGFSVMVFFILAAVLYEDLKIRSNLYNAHKSLKETFSKLQKMHSELETSEEKYRILSEEADQAIFLLDQNLSFKTCNNKARRFFGLKEDITENHFLDIVETKREKQLSSNITKQIVNEHLKKLNEEKGSVSFSTIIYDSVTDEPEEFEFYLDYLATENEQANYIGRAAKLHNNRLTKCIEYEKMILSIDNYIIGVDFVASRLTAGLGKNFDQATILHVKMGLQEIMVNGIEHGNLNITFDEKTAATESGTFQNLVNIRQKDPRYKTRKVTIEYVLSKNFVQYIITDEGDGFDYQKIMNKIHTEVQANMLTHGRGINMAGIVFDSIEYNNKGNEVLLTKRW